MDKLEQYRQIVSQVLTEYSRIKPVKEAYYISVIVEVYGTRVS